VNQRQGEREESGGRGGGGGVRVYARDIGFCFHTLTGLSM